MPGLKLFGRLESERTPFGRQGKPKVHYVAVSKTIKPETLLAIIREHWGVENQVHWLLDVVFNEDDVRTRKDNGPFNFSIIRRMALDILKAHPDTRSIARKMKMATWKKEYFLSLFAYLR